MGKKVLSIEIGLHTTKVCEVETGKKTPHVINCITFDTPENIVEDGFILDKDLMAQTLKMQLANAKMNVRDVIFTIASTKIANREVVVPLVPESKLQSIIDAQATEYFPLDVSEYTISYSILEKINNKDKDERKYKLLLLAAPNNLIKNIYAFAEVAGLKIQAIDYIGNSAYQLLRKQVGTGVNVSVQINDQTTLVNVIENEKLALQRTIPYGAMNIVSAVLDNSVFGKNNSRDAMQLLMQENIINARLDMGGEANRSVPMSSDDYDKVMREIRGREDVTSTIQYIMNNVNRVLDYYMSRNSEKRINAIYLTGVGGKFKGIEVLFSNETGYDVKKIDTLFGVSFAKGLSTHGSQSEFLTVIGASIAPVGFLTADARGNEKKGSDTKLMTGVFAASCVISLGLIVGSTVYYQYQRITNSSLNKEMASKTYIENVYKTHQQAKFAFDYAEYMYNQTSNRNYQFNELVKAISAIMPTNMQVVSMTSDATSFSMNIEATPDKFAIAKFMMDLQEIASVSEAVVPSITEEFAETSDADVETFTITCTYRDYKAFTGEKVSLENEKDALAEAEAEATQNPEATAAANAE